MATTTDHVTDARDVEQPSVLIVNDQQRIADLYADALDHDYDVKTAYSGETALETINSSFDVVVLDRKMPELPGDEILAEIHSRNLDCMVAMVTAAADPDLDIIEMPFDEYLSEPVSQEELRATVDRLVLRAELEEIEYELSSLRVKRNVLEMENSGTELGESAEFTRLKRRSKELRSRLTELRGQLSEVDRRL